MAESAKKVTNVAPAGSADELEAHLVGKREELRKLRFSHARRELKQTHQLGALRREVARLATALAHTTSAGEKQA